MQILYDENKKLFHLQNQQISYIMQVVKDGYLAHLYWGKKIRQYHMPDSLVHYDRGFSPQPSLHASERAFSLDTLPQEYPAYGLGDYKMPAYQVQLKNGSTISDLRYKSHKILPGKPSLPGLPATYALNEEDAQTLEIELCDTAGVISVFLSYTIYKTLPVITRCTRFINSSKEPLQLLNAASVCIDFREHNFERVSLYGAHANERNISRCPLSHDIQTTGSIRGASSHQQSPFLALVRPNTTEEYGEVYAFGFVYSGNFAAQTEVDQFGCTRVTMGLNPFDFSWQLKSEDCFQTPEAVLVYTDKGLNAMSQAYHHLYRTRLVRGQYKEKVRPILVNNWEATYFDFNEEKIEKIAACAAKIGIELFVLDDGWFGHRNNDTSSLGDWVVNKQKLPHGIAALAKKINEYGLQFGLWFEPEMVSAKSDLYCKHPNWCLHVPNHPHSEGRQQLILDLSRNDVCEYIIQSVSAVLSSAPISYVKWDMNRHMTEIGSALLPPERQRETAHRYILGLYHVMDSITKAFPQILFESCSGGGGRFDSGILYYMPQTWTSDNTDAICRLKIQYGTSLVFPPISMGSHVSVVPNHQVGRITPMQTRAFVAMSGNFGYELDLCKLSEEDIAQVKQHIALYKQIRPLVQLGDFHRLLSPFESNETAWIFTTSDKSEAVLMYFRTLAQPASEIRILRLCGLDPNAKYQITKYQCAQRLSYVYGEEGIDDITDKTFFGDELMNAGITVEKIDADFTSYMWILKKTH